MNTTRIHRSISFKLLLLVLLALGSVQPATAADVGLTMTLSPEIAALVRQWRREHGLPQAPEEPGEQKMQQQKMAADSRGAVTQALKLAGLAGASPNDLHVTATHEESHWQVTIDVPGETEAYVVEVADAVAGRVRLAP
ncbi:MAG TPA: hypothetical protein VFB32_02120 [Rudaea sp.]|nr:hypothetical protein [Rudaea sp.]